MSDSGIPDDVDLDELLARADRQKWSKRRLADELRRQSVPLNLIRRFTGGRA